MKITLKDGSSATWSMFGEIHPRLGVIFYDFVKKLEELGVKHVIISSIIRPKSGDSGIHALGRAIDISASTIPEDLGAQASSYINEKYIYSLINNKYNCVLYHQTNAAGDDGLHYHLQVGK